MTDASDAEVVNYLSEALKRFNARLTALEAELAVLRGTQSASRWSGDSPPMTIEPSDERRD